jgi:hypothetical protein
MISSFFNKTKPINYAVLLSFLFTYYWVSFFVLPQALEAEPDWWLRGLAAVLLLLTVVGVSLIIRQSKMTDNNSYPMLFYVVLAATFAFCFLDSNVVIANFFVMMSAYKLIYLNPEKNTALSFYNASLMLAIGALFDPMSILFMMAVGLGVYMNDKGQLKDWLALLAALITAVLWLGVWLVVKGEDVGAGLNLWKEVTLLDFRALDWNAYGPLLGFLVFVILLAVFINIRQGHQVVGKIIPLRLTSVYLFIGVVLFVLVGVERPETLQYCFFPACVVLAFYVESIRRAMWKEIFLVLVLLIPFITLILALL